MAMVDTLRCADRETASKGTSETSWPHMGEECGMRSEVEQSLCLACEIRAELHEAAADDAPLLAPWQPPPLMCISSALRDAMSS